MPDDILKDEIEVAQGSDTYCFAIPGYVDEIKLGIREKEIRRSIEAEIFPNGVGSADGLDNTTLFMVEVASIFESLLKRSSTTWPWSKGRDGKPVVDFREWPKDKIGEALAIGLSYRNELSRFRNGGVANGDAPSTEAMAGEPDTSEKSV